MLLEPVYVCVYAHVTAVCSSHWKQVSFAVPSCYVTTNCIGEPINSSITFAECCTTYGVSYNLDGRCQPCPHTSKGFDMLCVKCYKCYVMCYNENISLYIVAVSVMVSVLQYS